MGRILRLVSSCLLTVFIAAVVFGHPNEGTTSTIDSDDITRMVANSDYVFWGTVQAFEADTLHHALLDVRVDKELLGRSDSHQVNLVIGGLGFSQSHNPQSYSPGDQFLFFCFQSFDRPNENWHTEFKCGWRSVLRRSESDGNVRFCGDFEDVRVKDLGLSIELEINSLSPSELFEKADLVVLVGNSEVRPNRPVGGRCRILLNSIAKAEVIEVIKGRWTGDTVEFRLDADNEIDNAPILDTKKEYVLFLKMKDNGYVLVRNQRGCLGLQNRYLVWNKGLLTGCEVVSKSSMICE